jgi:folate-binding protein YgfZ
MSHPPLEVDQSAYAQLRASGDDRLRFLQGMLTADVGKLAPGQGTRACVLSVKGRVLGLLEVFADEGSFVLLTEPAHGDALLALLDKHLIADDVTFSREHRPLYRVWTDSESVWSAPAVWAPPHVAASPLEVEIRRIEAGLPRLGIDVTADHFPFEANLERAIAFDKGCYVGQEVVVRATTRGGAKKKLVGLRLAAKAVAAGSKVLGPDGAEVGTVTSSELSPEVGAIALAYVHVSQWATGTTLNVGDQVATVTALPFVP